MHFEDMNAFWHMGGYGTYVWLSFGMGALSVAVLWLDGIFAKRKLFRQILSEQARQIRISSAAAKQNTAASQKAAEQKTQVVNK
ncbi:heme exporter protein CcmD [uncultured Paraglaciecola sp.]|uniref:heme exporter protein CcmD n=1 Tax=uncultured Paraglaciecola sp. TaxID=1765024 RepID=UPI0026159AA8|nr:heme exporter protein CcmD [uncultured Paraglaciecola sp.]